MAVYIAFITNIIGTTLEKIAPRIDKPNLVDEEKNWCGRFSILYDDDNV